MSTTETSPEKAKSFLQIAVTAEGIIGVGHQRFVFSETGWVSQAAVLASTRLPAGQRVFSGFAGGVPADQLDVLDIVLAGSG